MKAESKKNDAISIQPKDSEGDPVYLAKVNNQSGVNAIQVGSKEYTRAGDHPKDGAFYLYLSGTDHIITANDITYKAVRQEDADVFTLKQYASTPTVTLDDSNTTASSITVTELPEQGKYGAAQYSLDNETWQTSNVFVNLPSGKSYTVYARYQGNDTYLMSNTGILENVTTKPASYTISIPETAKADGSQNPIKISETAPFDLGHDGTVIVKIKDTGTIAGGKLKLIRENDSLNQSITSKLFVNEKVFTDLTVDIAAFTMENKASAETSISFEAPEEPDIPAGTYKGTVTFEVSYTEQQ